MSGAATPRAALNSTPRGPGPLSAERLKLSLGATLASSKGNAVTPRSGSSRVKVPLLPGYSTGDMVLSQMGQQSARKMAANLTGPGGTLRGDAYQAVPGELPTLDLSTLEKLCDVTHRYDYSQRSLTHDERAAVKESARNTYRPKISPAWLKHDRQVLRFGVYYQEPVHDNATENFRVRYCTLHFYLEDGSMMISEPKIENCGLPQGVLVKRHRFEKPGGGCYTYHDLEVPSTLHVYGRAFRIFDADVFTRDLFEKALNRTLGPAEEMPEDGFRMARLRPGTNLLAKSKDILEQKEYNELAVGGNRKNAKLQQFLENDRKVLHFKALWDDHTMYGARMYYIFNFYLADDSVEILDCLARNSGRDPYPVFWRRAQLRKNPHTNPAPGMLEPEADLYMPEDLLVGQTVYVFNRKLFLYDCDDFTRDFYRQYMDLEQESMEIKEPEQEHVKLSYPPHTGFGAEEDSLVSCMSLRPGTRPPKKDITKLMRDSNNVLRWEAKMEQGSPEDVTRRFIIAVHLADDSVAVWEQRQRNSGHSAGKFALKSRKMNPLTGTWFKSEDFYDGAIIEVNSIRFVLLEADQCTVNYLSKVKDGMAATS